MSTELTMFHGKTAKEVFKQMGEWEVVSVASHAFDLGAELQKAEIALQYDLRDWKQDRRIDIDRLKAKDEVLAEKKEPQEQIEAPTRYIKRGKKSIPIKN